MIYLKLLKWYMDGLEMKVNVYDLLDIYEKEISINTKNKRKI